MPGLIAACNACLVHLKQAELFETVIPSEDFRNHGDERARDHGRPRAGTNDR